MLFHTNSLDEVVVSLQVSLAQGLSESESRTRRNEVGDNVLAAAAAAPWWHKLLSQFNSVVIWILIAAAIISGVFGEWTEASAILAIVLLNGLLGYVQEAKAEQALAALALLSSPTARVVREGKLTVVPARELAPGDIVELEAGDHIPADVRLARTASFCTQEAALTGESTTVEKNEAALLPAETSLGDRRNMAYMGTVAAIGRATAVVVATGMRTELGHIAGLLGREKKTQTPLQRRLEELGKTLVAVCLALVVVVFFANLLRGGKLHEVFLLSVSLAVAAIPEGLPAVVTIALALGLQRLVARQALVRKLPSVETLGSVTVICSDKTGTLTRNEMTVREAVVGERTYVFSGSGYAPQGEIRRREGVGSSDTQPIDWKGVDGDLRWALTVAARCNHAQLLPPGNERAAWGIVGDPTEGALLVAAMKAGIEPSHSNADVVLEIPFDSHRKTMSVVLAEPAGEHIAYCKGAPEIILERCDSELVEGAERPLSDERRSFWLAACEGMANSALRVLGLAYRKRNRKIQEHEVDEKLVFAGICGMIDPPREEVRLAVARCRQAGIRPVMITGDHPKTALAIARELGIAGPSDAVLTGHDLDRLSPQELEQGVANSPIYARVSAEHKLKVVEAWQAKGQIVAMTGDGVNDAPAIRRADIGIAMGITGSDVTKEASDMVLIDDNFASIVNAVEEGRCVFDNIQKFIHYLLACNAGEVILMFFAALAGWPSPLLAIQLLWINLVTDGLPALALGMETAEPDLMQRPPRRPHEPVLTREKGVRILAHGLLIAAATAIAFYSVYRGEESSLATARTVAFCVMSFSQLCFAFACRSQRYSMPELGLFTNRPLLAAIAISSLLQLAAVFMAGAWRGSETAARFDFSWGTVAICSLAPVTIIECWKIARHRLRGDSALRPAIAR